MFSSIVGVACCMGSVVQGLVEGGGGFGRFVGGAVRRLGSRGQCNATRICRDALGTFYRFYKYGVICFRRLGETALGRFRARLHSGRLD